MTRRPVFARCYAVLARWMDAAGERRFREEVAGGARGRVLEVGAGPGLNFAHYPVATSVVAVEPEPTMARSARDLAARAPAPVRLVRAAAEALPFPDAAFDTVVVTLVLCSVSDVPAAVAEIARVLAPDGEIRFQEHVRSPSSRLARWQDRLAPAWALVAGGCRPNREPLAAFREEGWRVRLRTVDFGPAAWLVRHHVVGVASRP